MLMVAATPYFADRGCHVRIHGEARALLELGADVLIVTYGLGRDIDGAPVARAPCLPGYRHLDAAPRVGKLALDLLLLGRVFTAARSFRPDVLHAHTQEGGAVALVVAAMTGLPVLLDLQSRRVAEELVAYGWSRPGGLLHRLADRFDRLLPSRADAVVASTEAIADFVRREAPPRGPVAVVGDAVEVGAEAAAADPALARALGLDPGRPVVGYLGLLTRTQGIDLLLAAGQRLRRMRPDVQLLVMGFPDVEAWRAEARALGLGDAARFTGRVAFEDAPAQLALVTVAASAKRTATEGNGKLLLYMACGLATVALDTANNRAILGPDGLYAADDADAFAAALAAALADPADRARRGAALRDRVRREASWQARALQLLDLYRRLGRRR